MDQNQKRARSPSFYQRKGIVALNKWQQRQEKNQRNADYPLVLRVERKLLEETLQLPGRGGIPKEKVTELQAAFKGRRIPWTPSQINRDEKLRLDARNYIYRCRAAAGYAVEDEGKYDGDKARRHKQWARGVHEAKYGSNWPGALKCRPPRLEEDEPIEGRDATGKGGPRTEADDKHRLGDGKAPRLNMRSTQYR
ncbi:MAG: hypothetical protein Q9195_006680 [Heterodermia aff. obscurata]